MISTSTILALIGSGLTVLSVTIAIFTFYFNRKKEGSDEGRFKGTIESDIKHIKDGVDELKTNTNEIKNDIQNLRERVVIVETSVKSAHHRIDDLQERRSSNDN